MFKDIQTNMKLRADEIAKFKSIKIFFNKKRIEQ